MKGRDFWIFFLDKTRDKFERNTPTPSEYHFKFHKRLYYTGMTGHPNDRYQYAHDYSSKRATPSIIQPVRGLSPSRLPIEQVHLYAQNSENFHPVMSPSIESEFSPMKESHVNVKCRIIQIYSIKKYQKKGFFP